MTEKNKKIKNRHISIFIDDPFDFKVPGKGKEIRGVIKRKLLGEDKQDDYWLVSVREPFNWKGAKISYFTIATRYKEEDIKNIFSLKTPVTVDIGRVLDESIVNKDKFDFKQVEYFAIGHVRA